MSAQRAASEEGAIMLPWHNPTAAEEPKYQPVYSTEPSGVSWRRVRVRVKVRVRVRVRVRVSASCSLPAPSRVNGLGPNIMWFHIERNSAVVPG